MGFRKLLYHVLGSQLSDVGFFRLWHNVNMTVLSLPTTFLIQFIIPTTEKELHISNYCNSKNRILSLISELTSCSFPLQTQNPVLVIVPAPSLHGLECHSQERLQRENGSHNESKID